MGFLPQTQNLPVPAPQNPALGWLSPELMAQAPEMVLHELGLMKARDGEDKKFSPGSVGSPNELRGHVDANPTWYSMKGVREYIPPIPYRLCREIRKRNPVVAAIINTRKRQLRAFSRPSTDEDTAGYRIAMQDSEATPTNREKDEIKWLEEFFRFTGRTDFKDWDDRDDTLKTVLDKLTEDYLTIDQVAVEIRRNRGGDAVDFWILDGATIKRVNRTGYLGNIQDIDPRSNLGWEAAYEKIRADKIALIPDFEDIRYVQDVNGRLIAAFTKRDLIFDVMNERTDIQYAGYGFALVEQCAQMITAFMYSMAYNMEQFSTGTLPKIALSFKNGNFGPQQLMQFQDQWIANFRGVYGAWRIPMLNGDVQPIDLYKNNRDMEFSAFVQFVASLICAVFGIDAAEMGLRLNQAQNVMNENVDAKLKFSKDRGLGDLLGQSGDLMNVLLRKMDNVQTGSRSKSFKSLNEMWRKYKFEFTGITQTDRDAESKLEIAKVSNWMTVNELRAEKDMKKIDGGDIILNPVYMQAMQMKAQEDQQAAQQGMEGGDGGQDWGGGGEDNADLDALLGDDGEAQLDQAADAMAGAMQKARTMLV